MNKTIYPKICIASIVQHANDIVFACRNDRTELEKAGLHWEDVELLATLLVKCSEADADWQIQKGKSVSATTNHKKYLQECRNLRSRLAANIRDALKILELDIKLPGYKKWWVQCDLVQDLNDLAVMCRINHEQFAKTCFDFELAEKAAVTSKELSKSMADLIISRDYHLPQHQKHHTAIYKELYDLIKKVSLYGRKAFRDDPLRKKNYHSIK
jgi:hypothetical protein